MKNENRNWDNYFLRMEMDLQERRMFDLENALSDFSRVTKQKLLMRLAQLGLKNRVALRKQLKKAGKETERGLYESIAVRPRTINGHPESIAIKLVRHGIFLEHGVGKYRPVGSPYATDAKKEWLSTVLPPAVEQLAELLSMEYADVAAGYLKINIPGIYATKISI